MRDRLSGVKSDLEKDCSGAWRGFLRLRGALSRVGFAAAATLLVACAAKTSNPGQFADAGPHPDASGVTIDSGSAPDGDYNTIDGGGNPAGPLVTIVSPTAPAAGDFSSDAIVTARVVNVVCSATPNAQTGDPVDASSVVVTATAGGNTVKATATPAAMSNQYQAALTLDGFANGTLAISCTAADTSSQQRQGSAEISTYLDLGPRIAVFSPVENAPYAKQVDISFQVTAAPVAAGDTGATPDPNSIEVDVAGTKLTSVTGDANGLYSTTVSFADFSPSLDGPNTVVITAADQRQSSAVQREKRVVFVADSSGPQIDIQSPSPGELISGIFSLTAKVTDPAGIDPASVVATIAGTHQFALTATATDTYTGSFDTRQLSGLVFPTIIVRARDSVGNQSSRGISVALDNQAPIASLNPPELREAKVDNTGTLVCSHLFDPLGGDEDTDGLTVPQLSEIRARVEDVGNGALSSPGVIVPQAGVDPDNVQLFILDDENGALLVDTDGDGICDAINPLLVPTSTPSASNEAAVINLAPLPPTGDSDFDPADLTTAFNSTGPESQCNPGSDTSAPAPICQQSSGTRIIATEIGGNPAIFSIPPAGGDQCWGFAFDSAATNIRPGFACLAVRAGDNLGNVGVSPPLRLCFDPDGTNAGGCPVAIGGTTPQDALPDCTGTYDPTTNTVDTGTPCTPPTSFAPGELRRTDL